MFQHHAGDIKDINSFLEQERSAWPGDKINPYGQEAYPHPKWAMACCWNTGLMTPQMQKSLCANSKVNYGHSAEFTPRPLCDDLIRDFCVQNTFDPTKPNVDATMAGNPIQLHQDKKEGPSQTILRGTYFMATTSHGYLGQQFNPGDHMVAIQDITPKTPQQLINAKNASPADYHPGSKFTWVALTAGGNENIPQDKSLCGCYNIDLSDTATLSKDEKLYKALYSTNSDLEPHCVINQCSDPAAYKNQDNRGTCPNVCSAISTDPTSQSYVGVKCSNDDIIVNMIDDTINNNKDASAERARDQNPPKGGDKPFYRLPVFYGLLGVVVLLGVLLTVKLLRRKK